MASSFIKQTIERARASTLAKNSGWMFLGYGLKIFVQAGYFVLIARALGPSQYGAFVGAVALIGLVAPFGGLGSGNLLVKSVSRDRSQFSVYWGNALFTSLLSGIVLVAAVMAIARFALPATISWELIALVSISDILAVKGAEIGSQCFQATDELRYTAFLTLLPYILRLIGSVIVFVVWRHATALVWGWFYLGCTVISAAVAVTLATLKLGTPKLKLSKIPAEIEEGFYFGASLSAQTVYNDIDKTMLARLSTLDATGIYAAAYRLIDVSFTPVRSVLNAAYANFFRHGQSGVAVSYSYAKKILPKMLVYALAIFVGLYVAAPIVPLILGSEYARTVEALRWLALLPFLKAIHYFLADSLTGSGYQRIRTAAQVAVAVFNVLLNLWLIPAYSWRGAAWSSLASDAALAITMYICLMFVLAKESKYGVRVTSGSAPSAESA
ncbi:MAG: flippase [Candidatus Acidiferrales bacterium]